MDKQNVEIRKKSLKLYFLKCGVFEQILTECFDLKTQSLSVYYVHNKKFKLVNIQNNVNIRHLFEVSFCEKSNCMHCKTLLVLKAWATETSP